MAEPMNVHVIDHPLIQHKLTIMRMKETGTKDFRELLEEISMLMAYEITRDFPLKEVEIETPICKCKEKMLAGKKVGVVPILRAGLGMLNGVVNMIPAARVGHVGMYRDPKTLKPVEYYCKLPGDVAERTLIVVDPMLATGGSLTACIKFLRDAGVKDIRCLTLVSAPVGVQAVLDYDPDVRLFTCALDRELNENAYILPGLGDAGDRIYGTK